MCAIVTLDCHRPSGRLGRDFAFDDGGLILGVTTVQNDPRLFSGDGLIDCLQGVFDQSSDRDGVVRVCILSVWVAEVNCCCGRLSFERGHHPGSEVGSRNETTRHRGGGVFCWGTTEEDKVSDFQVVLSVVGFLYFVQSFCELGTEVPTHGALDVQHLLSQVCYVRVWGDAPCVGEFFKEVGDRSLGAAAANDLVRGESCSVKVGVGSHGPLRDLDEFRPVGGLVLHIGLKDVVDDLVPRFDRSLGLWVIGRAKHVGDVECLVYFFDDFVQEFGSSVRAEDSWKTSDIEEDIVYEEFCPRGGLEVVGGT